MSEEPHDLHHLAAAYALDAVEPLEARRFESHLAGCERCRTEVGELRETAAQLAAAAAQQPPSALRARVLAEVAQTPQVSGTGTQTPHVSGVGTQAPQVAGPGTPTSPAPGRASRSSSPRRAGWLVAAAAVVVALVAVAGSLVQDLRAERDRAEELAAVLAAADARDAALEGSAGGTVRVVWSPSHSATILVATDLPPAASGHSYELWTFTPDGPVSAGVFGPGEDGVVQARLDLPADQVEGWGVTVEPIDGDPAPEGELVLRTT